MEFETEIISGIHCFAIRKNLTVYSCEEKNKLPEGISNMKRKFIYVLYLLFALLVNNSLTASDEVEKRDYYKDNGWLDIGFALDKDGDPFTGMNKGGLSLLISANRKWTDKTFIHASASLPGDRCLEPNYNFVACGFGYSEKNRWSRFAISGNIAYFNRPQTINDRWGAALVTEANLTPIMEAGVGMYALFFLDSEGMISFVGLTFAIEGMK